MIKAKTKRNDNQCQFGQVEHHVSWQTPNEIFNADYRDIIRLLPSESTDLVLTDPPYDDSVDYEELLSECMRICKPTGSVVMFIFPDHIWRFKTPSRQLCVWQEVYSPQGRHTRKYRRFFDLILWWTKSEEYIFNGLTRYQLRGIFDDSFIERDEKIHSWQKPEGLIQKLIRIHSNEGNNIFDPFIGSGTVCKVARDMKRNYLGTELEKETYQIAERRLSS
jgi:site-specific DNA-methyltransferase (adenine-specific)